MNDFNFSCSVTTTQVDRNKANFGSLQWTEINTNIDGLASYIGNGHAFCQAFHHNEEVYKAKGIMKETNLKSANMICFDFDAVRVPYNDFIDTMSQTELVPNISYRTRNDGHRKKDEEYTNRYRFVYVLDSPIVDGKMYTTLHEAMKGEIKQYFTNDTRFDNDTSDKNIVHLFCGNQGCEVITDHTIYSLDWLKQRYDITDVECANDYNKKNSANTFNTVNCAKIKFTDNDFSNMWFGNTPDDIILTTMNKYSTPQHTLVEYTDGELFTDLQNTDYYEIRHGWHKEEIEYKGGIKTISVPTKLKVGQRRMRSLYLACLRRRLITPNMTIEQLCYGILYDLNRFIDNTDENHIITRHHLLSTAYRALVQDLDDYRESLKTHKNYSINKEEVMKQGLTIPKAVGMINGIYNRKRKQEKYKEMAKWYDPSKKDKENLEILEEHDIKVSRRTLTTFKKEYKQNNYAIAY